MAYSFLTDYFKSTLLNWNWPATGSLYLALGTNVPEPSDTTISEPAAATNYARIPIPNSIYSLAFPNGSWQALQTGANSTNGSSGLFTNAKPLIFSPPIQSWGYIQSVALFNASTGGNMLFVGELNQPTSIIPNVAGPQFAAGTLKVGIQGPGARRTGFSSDYLNDYLIYQVLSGQAVSAVTSTNYQIALLLDMPQPSDDTTTIGLVEVSSVGTGYARQNLPIGSVFEFIKGRFYNSTALNGWVTPTADWGTIVATAILGADNSSATQFLWGGPLNSPTTVSNAGTAFSLLKGQLQFGLGCGW